MTVAIRQTWKPGGVLTDVTSIVFCNDDATIGIKRNDTDEKVVNANTAIPKVATGTYEYELTEPALGLTYTAYVKVVYLGQTYGPYEVTILGTPSDAGMAVNYDSLKQIVGHDRYGIRSGFTADQLADINEIINDGLRSVYSAHRWSFLRPLFTVTTAADDAEYDLPDAYDAIEGRLTYAADESDYYPPIAIVHEEQIRRRRQDNDDSDRPVIAAIVTKPFDPLVGSRRKIVFYPTPDDTYVLTARMRMRPTVLDDSHPYPLGGEFLAQTLIEACLAAGERLFDEQEGVHVKRFQELLALAIQDDKDSASPDHLGPDQGGELSTDADYRLRVGTITINGVEM